MLMKIIGCVLMAVGLLTMIVSGLFILVYITVNFGIKLGLIIAAFVVVLGIHLVLSMIINTIRKLF